MKILTATLVYVLALISLEGKAQEKNIDWLNKNAHPLTSDVSNLNDLSFLRSELKDKTVVALGEASHGTSEFYFQKGRIIRYLITQLNYKHIGVEFPGSLLIPANQYLQTGEGNLKEIMQGFALYKTKEIFDLLEWIKEYNQSQKNENKVSLFGCDREEYWSDPLNRDKYLAANIVSYLKEKPGKAIIWGHNVHIAKDTTMASFEAMGFHLKKEFGAKYYALGFDTFKGLVNILNDDTFEMYQFITDENTYSGLFAKSKYELFFLSFQKANPLSGQRNFITNIYSDWRDPKTLPIKPGVDFDGLIFIRNTSASVELK